MEKITNSPVMVQKEEISNLLFPAKEVLPSNDDIKIRRSDLELATKLGNAERGKIKIIFEDTEGLKKVETTIWATTEKNIVLKGGVFIPIHRIHQINVY
ncbi:MAG: hypothetical protein M3Q58_10680 [Bacteroidota bacterium]|nr:hypothetical protein [Bacteroidota bacterium]